MHGVEAQEAPAIPESSSWLMVAGKGGDIFFSV